MKHKLLNKLLFRAITLVAVMCSMFTGSALADDYERITSTDGLVVGEQYILVCEGQNKAMGTVSTYGTSVPATITSNTIVASSNMNILTLGGESGAWTFYTSKESQYLSWSSGNTLNVSATANTDAQKWTVSFSSNNAAILNKKDSSRKLQFNAGSPRFACYTSDQTAIQIYRKKASLGEATTITINDTGITNTNKFISTDAGSLSASVTYGSPAVAVPEASVIWSSDNDEVATINSTTGAITLVGAGLVTFTATYAGVTDEYLPSTNTYKMTVKDEDPDIEEIWSEDFSDYAASDIPTGGTYSYACVNGSSDTKIYNENNAGGDSPELLVGKSSGSFTAVIPLLYSTYGYSGNLTLTFKSNAYSINVKTTTDGLAVSGEKSSGAGVTFSTKETHKVTFTGITNSTENITIVFTATSSSNVRLDDIVLKGKKAELPYVATPVFDPAEGAVVSGQEVTISCATVGASIYYTTDGTNPSSSSTLYDPESKPTITAATTIKAIGIKDGLTNSSVAEASYTIAAPCATPTFSVAEGEVEKGTTVTISCATDGATIYYTTDETIPTTSSSEYSGAITINAEKTIKAIAVKDGLANSEIASATYTLRDYADLPFSFTSGSSAIASTTGLTASGLGSDYGSSNPPLKFDGTGDYIILKINAAPGELKFDIKGNTFSGGTFKVQYSADGSSYTDLKSYTKLGDTQSETFTDIPATTRYIKWIYTNKSSGNVGLGNIKLTGCEAVTVGSVGYTTYTTDGKVTMPDGVTAYIATAINTSTVHLEEVSNVPADEPIILKASKGTYYLPVITSDTDDVSANILEASDGNVTSDASYDVYALANKESVVGFYLVKAGVKVPEGKAYLKKATSPGAKEFLTFGIEDDADGINSLTPALSEGEGAIYNLAGQRIQKMQKGINIVNGKKVLR